MGFALMALPWLKRFGPWIVVALLALGVYVAATTIVHDWKKSIHDTAFKEGSDKESARQDAIARRIENVLVPRLDAIDNMTQKQLNQQNSKEIEYVDRIKTQIKNNPVYSKCVIDNGVLGDRNALRLSLQAALNSSSGASPVSPTTTTTADN